jgi:copper transport protein
VILVTGVGQAYAYVRDLDDLLDTAYGRAVLIKLTILLGLLVPLGAYNRMRSVPRLERIAAGGEPPGRAGLLLRRAIRGEIGLVVVVLGVTAALASYPPPVSEQSGPYTTDAALGPALMEMTVDPSRVGSNQIHLYLFDARTGAQLEGVEEVGLTASLPDEEIGPLELEPRRAGPGHYTVQGALLTVAGDWDLDLAVRLSAFDQYETVVEVPIR